MSSWEPLFLALRTMHGADIATVPFGALKKCLKHPLTDAGLKSFEADWEKVKAQQ